MDHLTPGDCFATCLCRTRRQTNHNCLRHGIIRCVTMLNSFRRTSEVCHAVSDTSCVCHITAARQPNCPTSSRRSAIRRSCCCGSSPTSRNQSPQRGGCCCGESPASGSQSAECSCCRGRRNEQAAINRRNAEAAARAATAARNGRPAEQPRQIIPKKDPEKQLRDAARGPDQAAKVFDGRR